MNIPENTLTEQMADAIKEEDPLAESAEHMNANITTDEIEMSMDTVTSEVVSSS